MLRHVAWASLVVLLAAPGFALAQQDANAQQNGNAPAASEKPPPQKAEGGGDEGVRRNDAAVAAMSDEEAKSHFQVGGALYDAGRFREAAQEFEKAYDLSRKPELLFNMYIAYRDAGLTEKAVDALRRYLSEAQDVPDRRKLETRLDAMEQTLKARQQQEKQAQQQAEKAAAAQAPSPSVAPAAEEAEAAEAPKPSPVPWIVMGTGAAILVAAAVTGGVALGKSNDIANACGSDKICPPGYPLDSERTVAQRWVRTTDVLWPIGLAAAGTGMVLLFVMRDHGSSREAPVQASGACSAHGCAGTLRVRF